MISVVAFEWKPGCGTRQYAAMLAQFNDASFHLSFPLLAQPPPATQLLTTPHLTGLPQVLYLAHGSLLLLHWIHLQRVVLDANGHLWDDQLAVPVASKRHHPGRRRARLQLQ